MLEVATEVTAITLQEIHAGAQNILDPATQGSPAIREERQKAKKAKGLWASLTGAQEQEDLETVSTKQEDLETVSAQLTQNIKTQVIAELSGQQLLYGA